MRIHRLEIEGFGQLNDSDGEKIGGFGPPTIAAAWIDDEDLSAWELVEGHAPEGLVRSELGAQLHLDKAPVTELVRRMGRRGLVRVERDPDDGRRRIVSLTTEGGRTLQELHGPALEVDRRLLDQLDLAEQQDLDRLLERALQDQES